MIRILVDNNKSRLLGDRIVIETLIDKTKLRVKNSWFAMQRIKGWDGYVRYITDQTHMFQTGLLPLIVHWLNKLGEDFEIEDRRDNFKDLRRVEELGGKEFRGYQAEAVDALLNNRFEGIRYQRGILHEATNAGKNLIAAGIFQAFSKKRKGIFLIDEKEIFDQAVEELSELMPGEVGFISSRKTKINRINVCMVQTLGSRCIRDAKLRGWLATQDIVIYDEADKSANGAAGKRILGYAYNATVRVALSGTPLMSPDKIKNQNLVAYFGPIVHHTSNKDLVDQGYSTPPDIKIFMGNKTIRADKNWQVEYELGIMENRQRHKKVWKLVKKYKNHKPCMIMFKHHKHGRRLLGSCPDSIKEKYRVEMVHHKTANRKSIISDFKAGKIDILICSMIIRRGKNLPLTKMMINAAGGDSVANVLQLLGRLLRKDESKDRVLFIDFYDWGAYLQRHSKHRIRALKKEKFEVAELYKTRLRTIQMKWKDERKKKSQKRTY